MAFAYSLDDLLAYTEWDRAQWRAWFRKHGAPALAVGLGAHSDGKLQNIGELIRHIFSAEQRYVERCREVPLSDTSKVPAGDVEALFAFGDASRRALRELLATFPEGRWDESQEHQIGPYRLRVTPRTMIIQAVTHELRHWAQVATLLRQAGFKTGDHDYLTSTPGSATRLG